jgi:hypothetical protein
MNSSVVHTGIHELHEQELSASGIANRSLPFHQFQEKCLFGRVTEIGISYFSVRFYNWTESTRREIPFPLTEKLSFDGKINSQKQVYSV